MLTIMATMIGTPLASSVILAQAPRPIRESPHSTYYRSVSGVRVEFCVWRRGRTGRVT